MPEQAEDFLHAHSTTASVPNAPLSVVQSSAEALETDLDQKVGQAPANSGEPQTSGDYGLQRAQSEAPCQAPAGEWSSGNSISFHTLECPLVP